MSDSLRPHGLLPCPLLPPSWHKFMSTESVMPSYHLSLCHSLPFLPSVFPTSRSFPMNWPFASGGQSIGVSASTSFLPTNIQDCFPFRMDCFYLLAVQGSLKSLLQHHSSKALILQRSSTEFSSFLSIRKHLITLSLNVPEYKIKLGYLSCRVNVVILYVKGLANGKCSK